MGKIKDLTGQRFGKLVVLEPTNERRNRQVVWKCQCDCGNTTYVVGEALRTGHTKSCGCLVYETKNVNNLIGQRFGKLIVISRNNDIQDKGRHAFWNCKCDCGNTRIVRGTDLKNKTITACYDCTGIFTTRPKDIAGQRFGKLIAIEPSDIKLKRQIKRIVWKCQCDCGNIVYTTSNSLQTGNITSCGCAKHTSIGEENIKNLLLLHNINFIRQYTFEDCLSPKGSRLIFDFAVLNNNNELIELIEYDGIQHFQPIAYFGGQDKFEYLQLCDQIKNLYCKQNNIKLVRIPYRKNNIITLQDLQLDDKKL